MAVRVGRAHECVLLHACRAAALAENGTLIPTKPLPASVAKRLESDKQPEFVVRNKDLVQLTPP